MWFMVKAPRRDGILWNMVSRMQQRKYVDVQKGERKREETWWWNEQVVELRRKKRGIRNGGKTGVKRIWRRIRC